MRDNVIPYHQRGLFFNPHANRDVTTLWERTFLDFHLAALASVAVMFAPMLVANEYLSELRRRA